MKVLLISGSRNPEGQTAAAGNAFLEGVSDAGGSVEQVFLPQMNVAHCRQCDDKGWGDCRAAGKCVIDDDFAGLVEKIRSADAVAFSTPVYYGDLSESTRAFTDRLRRICTHESGKTGIAGMRAVGICVAGGGGGGAPHCCFILEKVLSTCGLDLVDMIPARRQNLDMKKDVLRTVGKWLAGS